MEKIIKIPSEMILRICEFSPLSIQKTAHLPRHRIRIELIGRIVFREQLHSDNGKYVNDND